MGSVRCPAASAAGKIISCRKQPLKVADTDFHRTIPHYKATRRGKSQSFLLVSKCDDVARVEHLLVR